MKKILFIIPGYTHKVADRPYRKIKELFEEKGFIVIPVQIHWKDTTISENVIQFLKEFKKIKTIKTYVLGFSFGAIIAYLASTKVQFSLQILCSLSPYFQEDIPYIKKSWIKSIGKRRFDNFSQISNSTIAPKVKTRSILLYGTKEGEFINRRANETYQSLTCEKELIFLDGVKHDIGDEHYLKQIKLIAEQL